MNETRERLMQLLSRYFDIGDSYTYNLIRVKSAFAVDKVYLEDFEEYTENDVANLADYLIEEGAILPQVKVGQTVWCLIDSFNHAVEGKVYEYNIRDDGIAYFRFFRNGYFSGAAMEDAIGKTVFLTREAAEEAMKAKEKQNDR